MDVSVPIWQMREKSVREGEQLAQGCTAEYLAEVEFENRAHVF